MKTKNKSTPHLPQPAFGAQRLALAILLALPLLEQSALAQPGLVVDPSAALRPVLSTSNGTPLVNIVAANGAGLSHNKFTEFNVGQAGLILNNSTTGVQTSLGGAIAGNSLLNGQSASVILNEVTGKMASQLNGVIEVAGANARVIVANPNGISTQGAGFINANRVTLVAGNAVLDGQGGVARLHTENGQIRIEGAGLDGSGANEVDLVARTIQLNAALQAQKLNLSALKGDVSASNTLSLASSGSAGQSAVGVIINGKEQGFTGNQIIINGQVQSGSDFADKPFNSSQFGKGNTQVVSGPPVPAAGVSVPEVVAETVAPEVAIDVARLGSMHADSIRMLGRSAGVGVNVAGQVKALTGNLTVTADGKVQVAAGGALEAGQALSITGGLDNQGQVSGARVSVNGDTLQGRQGSLVAHGSLSLQGALENHGTLRSGQAMTLNASKVFNDNLIHSGASLTAYGALENHGILRSEQSMTLNNSTLFNDKVIHSGASLTLLGSRLDNTASGTITSRGRLTNWVGSQRNQGVLGGGYAEPPRQSGAAATPVSSVALKPAPAVLSAYGHGSYGYAQVQWTAPSYVWTGLSEMAYQAPGRGNYLRF
ncbi:filamentous hemagglutinin N-terminal domain-containing protein [Pseudomonas protegens]|uniref:filamentous hemagglutinin N-terminal domain-containing protein n=1 Tax=Pseudomonas protegens TaxID=380021 RepID=UPI00384F45F4